MAGSAALERLFKLRRGSDFFGQFLAKESRRDQHFVDAPQPIDDQMPQTAAHRIAHDQRTGKHRRGRHYPQRHGEIGAPMER